MNFTGIILILLAAIISYLFGSINFAIIISKLFIKKDVRDYGSGNAGMTNVVRTAGKLAGILTLLGDIIKGAAAVAIGRFLFFPYIFDITGSSLTLPIYGAFFCGVFCMLGHVFPVFFGFKGGKAVATTVGISTLIDWRMTVIALSIFLIIFLLTKIVSIGSIFAAASLTLTAFLLYPLWSTTELNSGNRLIITALAAVLSIIIIAKHKDNIKRLINGEEKRIKSKSK